MMDMPRAKAQKQIIAIANEKGGVAKTTTTISLGGALVEAGYEVLLVDLDTQANLTLGLGLVPSRIRRSVADVLMNSASLVSVSKETNIPGLDVVPANSEMGLAERFLPMRQNYESILKAALANLQTYDFIILDCPPSLGAVTYNALTAAHRVIAPTQPEYFSAYGLRSMMGAIRRIRGSSAGPASSPAQETTTQSEAVQAQSQAATSEAQPRQAAEEQIGSVEVDTQQRSAPSNTAPGVSSSVTASQGGTNPSLVYHVLITMMDRRNKIHRTLAEQLSATFGPGLMKTVIEVDTKLRESSVAGTPITHYNPQSRSAQQYRLLAQEIIQYVDAKNASI